MKVLQYILLCACGWWLTVKGGTNPVDVNNDRAVVTFCDVGQGDAIIISYKKIQMLVDGGPGEQVLRCLDNALPFGDRDLDAVVLTHPDADHIGGLSWVLQKYTANIVLSTSLIKETADFEALSEALEKAQQHGTIIMRPSVGLHITPPGPVQATVLTPQEREGVLTLPILGATETLLSDKKALKMPKTIKKNEYNDWSIALFIQLYDTTLLLTGDLEKEGEIALVESGLIQDVDILKVAHHGSKSSSTTTFLDVVKPEDAVVSVGKNNRYGHPSPEVINRFAAFSTRVWRTDQSGTVTILIDKSGYSVVSDRDT